MAIVIALSLGIATGIIGFVPLLVAKRLSRHRLSTVREHSLQIGLGCVIVSVLVLFLALVIASQVAAETFVFYGSALIAAFLIASSVFAIIMLKRGGD